MYCQNISVLNEMKLNLLFEIQRFSILVSLKFCKEMKNIFLKEIWIVINYK